MKHHTPLAAMIHQLREEVEGGDLTLGEIHDILSESGHSFVMLFLCLPFMQPIPLPGLSTPLGILIALSAILQAAGKDPWIPRRWRNRDLGGPVVRKVLEVAEKAANRASGWIYPRWSLLIEPLPARWFNALTIVINAVLLALPLPIPFSNTVPAVAIVIHSLGHIERDGVFVAISHVLFLLCVGFFATLAFGVEKGLQFF